MPTYNDPIGKAESAFVAIVEALTLTGRQGGEDVAVTVRPGRSSEAKLIPQVTCVCNRGNESEAVQNTGIFTHNGLVEIETDPHENTNDEHSAIVQAVHDAIQVDDIASQLSAAVADYHVYQVVFGAPDSVEGQHHITQIPFRIVHCCSDLT